MKDEFHYIIRGGDAGAERLRVLSGAMRSGTLAVLDRAGIAPGLAVVDLGCGSGEATMDIARRVGPHGRVVGIDMDDRELAQARVASEASALSIQWKAGVVEDLDDEASFDIAYARFLLSHLRDPAAALRRMRRSVRPSGRIVVEDIDITTHAHWPPSAAFHRYIELYAATGRARGVDPVIGPRLAAMLIDAGLEDVEVSISMPVFRTGEGKTIARLTLSNIADAAISSGLTDRAEVDRLLAELASHEADPRSIQSTAQVFQVIGRCP
ncbi:MAG: methyltransferase domain-containing protein [Candidatus Binatia bacterium]